MDNDKRLGARVNPSGPESWFVRTGMDFLEAWAKDPPRGRKGQPLGDQHLVMLLVLDGLAGFDPFCWPSNDWLAAMTGKKPPPGKKPRIVPLILEDLEAANWLRRVMVPGSKGERAGIVLLRRVDHRLPVADTPERLAEATAALLARGKPRPEARIPEAARAQKIAPSRAQKNAPCGPARAQKIAPELDRCRSDPISESDSERAEGSRINDNDSESVGPLGTGLPLRCEEPGLREARASRKGVHSSRSVDATPTDPTDPAPGAPERPDPRGGQSASTIPSEEATRLVKADLIPDPALAPPAAPSNQPDTYTDIQTYGDAGNREFIESLTPERRAKLDRIHWGRRDDILRRARQDLAKGKPPRKALERLDLAPEPRDRAAGAAYPPPDATTAELLEALPAVRDASIVPKVARLLMDDLGDKPRSWPCIHGLIEQVWRGHAPAAALAEPYRNMLAQLADREGKRPIANPAAYFIESVKKWVHDHANPPG